MSLPDVQVTAESRIRELLDDPRLILPSLDVASSEIGQAGMQRQGARVLTDALRYLPGTWSETRGRKVKEFVSYRGQVYPYPDFSWNGLWLPEFHEMPYLVPVTALERVEVLRSSSGLFLGMGGDVGVINLVPRAPEGPSHLMLRGASHGTAEISFFSPLSPEPGGLAVAAGYSRTDGPKGQHAQEDLLHAMMGGEWGLGPSAKLSAHALALQANRELAHAKPPAAKRLQETDERYEPFQAVLAGGRLDLSHPGDATTSFGLAAAYRYNDFVNHGVGGHISLKEEDGSATVDVTHARRLSDTNRLRVGAVYNRWVNPDGKRFFEGRRSDVDTYALILADEQQVGAVLLDGGVRVTRRYLRDYSAFGVGGSSAGFENVAAVEGEWEEPRVRLTGGARWFAASTLEFFAHAAWDEIRPRSGTLDVDLETPGNEDRLSGDLGLRHRWGNGAVAELVGFAVRRDDGLRLDGATAPTPSGRELELYRNQDMRQQGGELALRDLPLREGLRAFANLTYVESKAREGEGGFQTSDEIPAWIAATGLEGDWGPWSASTYLKHVSAYENARFAADATPKPLGDFLDLQARLARRLSETLILTLSVENLLDERYATAVGYPDSGRRYGLRMDWLW